MPIYTTGDDRGVHYYAMELIDGPSLDRVIRDLMRQANPQEGSTSGQPDDSLPAWVRETALYLGRDGERPDVGQEKEIERVEKPGQDGTPKGEIQKPISARDQRQRTARQAGSLSHSGGLSQAGSSSSIRAGSGYFDTVARMMADVADALDHAHEQGLIHRDVKPSNLLLSPDGRLSINDFGLARMLEQPGMTISGDFVGSPLYMSPEQITAGRAPLDHRTDIYSLGATLYELLTLQPPFPGESRDQVISKILHKEVTPPRRLNRRLPTDLETICLKAIEKDPDRRYQTAAQMPNDLRCYVNRHAISARRIGVVGRVVKWVRRNRAVSVLFVLLVITAGIAAGFWHQGRLQDLRKIDDLKIATLSKALNGDFGGANEKLAEAKRLNAPEGWIKLMEGQIKMLKGDYVGAQFDITQSMALMGTSTAAQAMLTTAYGFGGQKELFMKNFALLGYAKENCLLDVIDVDHQPGRADESCRPNQILAIGGLPFPILSGL